VLLFISRDLYRAVGKFLLISVANIRKLADTGKLFTLTLVPLNLMGLGKAQMNLAFRSSFINFGFAELNGSRKSTNEFGFSLVFH
jgi:hypothetical protein